MRECIECGTAFQPNKHNQVYCSLRCRQVARNKKRGSREKARREHLALQTLCSECGKEYQKIAKALTCGPECSRLRRNRLMRGWKKNNRKSINRTKLNWHNAKMSSDPVYALNCRVRSQLRKCLKKRRIEKSQTTYGSLGFSPLQLRNHLESQFVEGMSWDNMGEWHIDHIRPIASFTFDSVNDPEFEACWALENLQPLWATDNLSKGAKWNGE